MLAQLDFASYYTMVVAWFSQNIFVTSTLIQLSATIIVLVLASLLSHRPQRQFRNFFTLHFTRATLEQFDIGAVVHLTFPIIAVSLQWLLLLGMAYFNLETRLVEIIAKLLTAWVVIRCTTSLVRYPLLSKTVAIIAWSIAALSILGYLDEFFDYLRNTTLSIGNINLTLLMIIEGVVFLIILLWVATALSRVSDRYIRQTSITPSAKVLISKLLKIFLIVSALLIGANSLGVDLTALAVFSGAIGLGVGIGLQKVASNFISGIILLLDKSVKPGDVIEVGMSYGWVNALRSHYVSVITRDGVEHLIPNEKLITETVVNWSFSHRKVRIKLLVGISYDSDVERALAILLEAADEVDRVLKDPAPVSCIKDFGDSAIVLRLTVWLNDPPNGVTNLKGAVYLRIWKKFKEQGIMIPFPQRDLHVKSIEGYFNMVGVDE